MIPLLWLLAGMNLTLVFVYAARGRKNRVALSAIACALCIFYAGSLTP